MLFSISFYISAAVVIVALIETLILKSQPYKQHQLLQPLNILLVGVFLGSAILFFPIYLSMFTENGMHGVKSGILAAILSLHNAIRLYIVDGEFSIISDYTVSQDGWIAEAYNMLAAIMFIAAPILTFSAVLTFFQNVTAHRKYLAGYFRDAYIFSELNEKSLTLALSLKSHDSKRVIVFTDVYKNDDERSFELIERAKELGAILFKGDISVVNFKTHSKKAKLYFFLMGEDEAENINQLIVLAGGHQTQSDSKAAQSGYDYPAEDNRIYLFSFQHNYDNLTNLFDTKYIKIRKVNEIQSLIYRLLYDDGDRIFNSAIETEKKVINPATGKEENEKLISAVIVGLGLHGKEMMRALTWFGQMFPYRLEISAFDKKENVESQLKALYPELLNSPHNGDFTTAGDAHYKVDIFPDTDVCDLAFEEQITGMENISYIMVSLGDDDMNIKVATRLRIILERSGKHPVINAIVCNPDKYTLFTNGYTHSGSQYDIVFCGNTLTHFSENCILQSEVEETAFNKHMSYSMDAYDKRCKEIKKEREEAISLKKKHPKEYKAILKQLKEKEAENEKWLNSEKERFWKIDYNYRSSTASIIHTKFKKSCKLPGADKEPKDRTIPERDLYRIVEHQRWNAYVRSEGFIKGPKKDMLIKTHPLLVRFDELSPKDQEKDD